MTTHLELLSGTLTPIHWSPNAMDMEHFQDAIRVLETMESAHQYWIGDALLFAKKHYGEEYAQLIPEGKAETWRGYEWVCSRVPIEIRKQIASFTHARVMARLTLERQRALLSEVNMKGISTRDLSEEVRKITRSGSASSGDLPDSKFRIIYADPPWQYTDTMQHNDKMPAEDHYKTMPLDDICNMPVKGICEEDAVLFLWVTSPLLLSHAPAVITSWGFEYKANIVWNKMRHVVGHYTSVRHEHLLIATRGSCVPAKGQTSTESVQAIKAGKHSVKPKQFRDHIDRMYPKGNRIELFARGDLPEHWTKFGNQ